MPMFEVESPLFHVTHAVSSAEPIERFYAQIFGRPTQDLGYWDEAGRHGLFTLIADVLIETVAPGPKAGGLRSFVDRRGPHLHSLAWHVRGIDELVERLRSRHMRFVDTAGNPVVGQIPKHGPVVDVPGVDRRPDDWLSAEIYTFAKDTHGMHEFCEPSSHEDTPRALDPRRRPGWQLVADDNDPLAIERGSHMTIVVRDVEPAVRFWREVLDAEVVTEDENEIIGSHSVYVRAGTGTGTVVELAQPTSDGPARADLDDNGEILHAVWFRTHDLDAVKRHLAESQVSIEREGHAGLTTMPESCHGARFGFTSREWS